ncbi:MAG: maltotransferase domain-containing protein, partial [Verrucomicrobiota bacterium]
MRKFGLAHLTGTGNILTTMTLRPSTVTIENLQPLDEGGRYPLKRIVGDTLRVEADIFKDGHDLG